MNNAHAQNAHAFTPRRLIPKLKMSGSKVAAQEPWPSLSLFLLRSLTARTAGMADGRRGSGKRVWKYYPTMDAWGGEVEVIVLDETVLQTSRTTGATILEDVCRGAGQFIGLGRFRTRNNGFYGRFDIIEFKESSMAKAA